MPCLCSIRGTRVRHRIGVLGYLAVAFGIAAGTAGAQAPSSNLGLPAAGAVGVFASGAWLERDSRGQEAGAVLDLGWVRSPRLRVQGEVAFLRGHLTETVIVEDETYEGSYFDVTAAATIVLLGGRDDSRLAPYVLASLSVHAMSSAFGTFALDHRYNTNRFGSQVGLGLRSWLGASGRRGLFVEVRRVLADEVMRTVVRAGGLVFLGDLVRAAAPR